MQRGPFWGVGCPEVKEGVLPEVCGCPEVQRSPLWGEGCSEVKGGVLPEVKGGSSLRCGVP